MTTATAKGRPRVNPAHRLGDGSFVRFQGGLIDQYRELAFRAGYRTFPAFVREAVADAVRSLEALYGSPEAQESPQPSPGVAEAGSVVPESVPPDVLYTPLDRGGRRYTFEEVQQVVAENPELGANFDAPEAVAPYFYGHQSRLVNQMRGLQFRREREAKECEEQEQERQDLEELERRRQADLEWEAEARRRASEPAPELAPNPGADPEARRVWSDVLEVLERQAPRSTFETWLRPTEGVAMDDSLFVVEAPTPFAVSWLERRIFHALQSALERVLNRPAHLVIRLRGGGAGGEDGTG